jgi:phenylalanyl-tRNA synthetase alpha chain
MAEDLAFETLRTELLGALAKVASEAELEALRVEALGKKGKITEMMKTLGSLDPEIRKATGAALNTLKTELTDKLAARQKELAASTLAARLAAEKIDVTLPARPMAEGRVHPISQTVDEIVTIFASMGFKLAKGPDVEDDWRNFAALNMPPDHPARQMQDTFYLPPVGEQNMVLRTHTSPVQIRTMMREKPPIRIIAPGRTYRCDYDMTHTPMFHQFEGLVIDETTTMAHLKGVLLDFLRAFFGVPDLPIRFRPSYFPFTEPSAEVDIGCSRKGGELKLGNYGDWLEVLGCGMVNRKVIANCGLDPLKYQGYAFGTGIERLAMLKYGIPDLRTFFDADLRWLRHYGFAALDIPNPAFEACR